jgi:hypothetical protein
MLFLPRKERELYLELKDGGLSRITARNRDVRLEEMRPAELAIILNFDRLECDRLRSLNLLVLLLLHHLRRTRLVRPLDEGVVASSRDVLANLATD